MRARRILAVVLLFAAATAVIIYLFLPVNLKAEARKMMHACLNHDASALYRYSARHERESGGLTREKWIRVYAEIIRPRIEKLRVQKISDPWGDDGPAGQAGVDAELIDDEGRVYGWTVQVNSSDYGPATVLMDLLAQTWFYEYVREHGKSPNDVKSFFQAALDGLAKDRPLLEAIGLEGKVGPDPGSPLRTWDELERYYLSMMASEK